jgi:hypothetical protein
MTGHDWLPTRMGLLVSDWAMTHISRLGAGLVFIGLPAIVVVVGGAMISRIWREDHAVRSDKMAALALVRRNPVVALLAAATLLAVAILAAAIAHVITD